MRCPLPTSEVIARVTLPDATRSSAAAAISSINPPRSAARGDLPGGPVSRWAFALNACLTPGNHEKHHNKHQLITAAANRPVDRMLPLAKGDGAGPDVLDRQPSSTTVGGGLCLGPGRDPSWVPSGALCGHCELLSSSHSIRRYHTRSWWQRCGWQRLPRGRC